MEEREFIVGMPYQTNEGYCFNVVKNNVTRVIRVRDKDKAEYLSGLIKILHEAGIDFNFLG